MGKISKGWTTPIDQLIEESITKWQEAKMKHIELLDKIMLGDRDINNILKAYELKDKAEQLGKKVLFYLDARELTKTLEKG